MPTSSRLVGPLLAVAALLVTLAFAELALLWLMPQRRALRFYAYRSVELHHVYPADERLYVGHGGRHLYLNTNRDGLRTHYTPETIAGFDERIVVLGDSFVLGIGVADDETVPARLEALLRAEAGGREVAVLNAGIASYSPMLEKLQLRKVIAAYRPTLVVLLLDATDIGDDYKYADVSRHVDGDVAFKVRDMPLPRYRGALFELVRPHLRRLDPLRDWLHRRAADVGWADPPLHDSEAYDYYDFRLEIDGVVETDRFFVYRHPLERTRPFFDATLGHIDEIAETASALGADFVVFVAPRFQHWNPRECPENWEADAYSLDEPHAYEYFRYFAEAAERRSYPIVDLLPDFRATDRFPLVFRHDPHWNTDGNRFVAERIRAHLIARDLWRPDGREPQRAAH